MQPETKAGAPAAPAEPKPLTPVEEIEVEIFSTDLEIEQIRQKLEKQQEVAEKKIKALMLRRVRWTRALATEREHGGGWTPMNGREVNKGTGEVRP